MISAVIAVTAKGQQMPFYSQYMNNDFFLNPAVAGSRDHIPIALTFRKQWSGINYAPSTQTLSAHSQVFKNMGVGGILFNDKTGPDRRTGFELAYAYHFQVTEKSKLSLGIAGYIMQYVVDNTMLTLNEQDDIAIQNNKSTDILPDASGGAFFYSDKYYIGLSAPQLFQTKIEMKAEDSELNTLVRHYFFTGGYKFTVNDDFEVEPSLLMKAIVQAPVQLDINAKTIYKKMVWLGASYRHNESVVIMIGAEKNNFRIGYSYDATLSNIRKYSSGSHEIFLGMNIPKRAVKTKSSM